MKKVTVIMLCVMLVATLFVVGCDGGTAEPEYIPAPWQVPGRHSSLSTSSYGSIRDDELADYIGSKMLSQGPTEFPPVQDVIIMFNSCYGGGFADDFQRNFGISSGVTWIFGSASQPNETACGLEDGYWTDLGFGSMWTDALAGNKSYPWDPVMEQWLHISPPGPGSIRDRTSDNVLEDFEMARDNDLAGPEFPQFPLGDCNREHPLIACGIGGENIQWNAGMRYEAVVFGGLQTDQRHHNNVDNVEEALEIVWSGSSYTIQKIDGGTKAELLSAIDDACSRLDFTTTLVLYFDDHGAKAFDIDEYEEWMTPVYYTGGILAFPLESDWQEDFSDMHTCNQTDQGNEPAPFLTLGLVEPIYGEEWTISLNDVPIALPAGNLTGECELAVNWTSIHTGNNTLEISPLGEPSGPMVLDNLELCSGPINEFETTLCILTISSTDGGSVTTPGEGTSTYDCGTVVDLVATPDAGYQFDRWTGDVDTIGGVYDPSTTITMNDNYEITANFQLAP